MNGKVVLIAGASGGIGRAAAEAFARRGARLALMARSAEVEEAAAACRTLGAAAVLAAQCDIANYAEVEAAVARVTAEWGAVDALINSAAVLGATGPIWTTDPALWNQAIDINLKGTYHTMRAVLPGMIERRSGRVVNFAGGGAAYGYPNFTSYAASKAAVVRLTETVATECAPFGIQANVIAPGAIETDLLKQVREAGGEVRTVGSMDLALDLMLFLVSARSAHVSGRFIHARDSYLEWGELPADQFTLRRVQ